MAATDIAGQPRLLVAPERPSLDTELRIRLHDVPPGGEVTLHASMSDPHGLQWRSSAVFRADSAGVLDLRRDAAVRGDYHGVDPMGLIWSMRQAPGSRPDQPVDFLAPTPLRLTAEVTGAPAAAVEVPRRRVPDGLHRTDVRDHGLIATLFRPERGGPFPGVVMLGGAEGGMHEDDAALLAAHGFAALALAYYGVAGLPVTLANIPLGYFGQALDYLRQHSDINGDRLAVMGGSKGGEAALLVAATFPHVRAAVSVVGSGLITQGISQDVLTGSLLDILTTPVANWTWHGHPLPYLPTW
jgi:hypothetical protein